VAVPHWQVGKFAGRHPLYFGMAQRVVRSSGLAVGINIPPLRIDPRQVFAGIFDYL